MERKYKRLSEAENFMSKLIARSGVSAHYFIGDDLMGVRKEWDDMVFVDTDDLRDRGALASGSCLVYLYVRPTGDYLRKNVRRMNEMERLLDDALASSNDAHYKVRSVWRDSGYNKDVGFHFNVVCVSVVAV